VPLHLDATVVSFKCSVIVGNKHLQTALIEAAKMAPRNSPELAMIYEQEKQRGNANRATLAIARKMVAYLVAVDRRQKGFLVVENENRTAA
jgi:transposase